MTIPTSAQVFGVSNVKLGVAFTALDLDVVGDARTDAHTLINALNSYYQSIPEADRPSAYKASKSVRNIDIDTQRQTFTFTFDMALVIGGIEGEPVTP
jgi:hypothetical protein